MSGGPQYEEDVFVEDDLEEDEYLYQVAINFGDPKSQAIESLEYEDDSEEESKPGSSRKKASLPHNPRSNSANAGEMNGDPLDTSSHIAANIQNAVVQGFDSENIGNVADGHSVVLPESILEYAKVRFVILCICISLQTAINSLTIKVALPVHCYRPSAQLTGVASSKSNTAPLVTLPLLINSLILVKPTSTGCICCGMQSPQNGF